MQTSTPSKAHPSPNAPEPFVHQVHAPTVPTNQRHANQRNFCRGQDCEDLELDSANQSTLKKHLRDHGFVFQSSRVEVFRWGNKDAAELILKIRINGNECTTVVQCSAAELREIAARLLDAAYDIEAFPASHLQVAA